MKIFKNGWGSIQQKIIFTFILLLVSGQCFPQQKLSDIAELGQDSTWMKFRLGISTGPISIFENYRDAFGLTAQDEMMLIRLRTDSFGYSHYRYQQYYQGIEVGGGEISIHAFGDSAVTGNGRIIKGLSMNTVPTVNATSAKQSAIDKVRELEAGIRGMPMDSVTLWLDSSYLPQPELEISKLSADSTSANSYRLSYRVEIAFIEPSDSSDKRLIVMVDASNGDVREVLDGHMYSLGTVNTLYNGTQDIQTKWGGSLVKYRLIDETRGTGITTRRSRTGLNQYLNDGDNDWNDNSKKRMHASAHWAAAETWDFFVDIFERNGPHGNGGGLDLRVDHNNANNVFGASTDADTDPLRINLVGPVNSGDQNATVSVGIVGHEFVHGVLSTEADFTSSPEFSSLSEAAALMEGICDIFGEMVENHVNGGVDWFYASEVYNTNSYLRTFFPPVLNGTQAMEYGDDNWLVAVGASKQRYDHAGVLLHWFYLLSNGGSGINHLGNEYCVYPIGIEKTGVLLYETIVNGYFNTSSTYLSTREATISYANIKFGHNSNEVAQITQAWYAVAVGSAYSGPILIDDYTLNGTDFIGRENEIVFNDLQNNLGSSLIVTSNTRITVNEQSKSSSGSYFHAYISPPPCQGSARFADPNLDETDDLDAILLRPFQEKESKSTTVLITPNPNSGTFTISGTDMQQIHILEASGKLVRQMRGPFANNVEVSGLSAGLYIVRIQMTDGSVENLKVMVAP